MSHSLTLKQFTKRALSLLEQTGDAKTAAQSKTYFKPWENVSVYGIKAPQLRQIEKSLFQEVKGEWSVIEAIEFCQTLVLDPHLEAKTIGFWLLSRFQKSFERDLLPKAKSWLMNNHCNNWAAIDTLCPSVITPLVQKFPDLIPEIKSWTASQNLWVRRAAAVTFVPLARKGELLGAAYEIAKTLLGDAEDLIHKATGWLLREAGKADPERLEAFLLNHGPQIPRTTLRYAIERFPEAKRKALLHQTKGL